MESTELLRLDAVLDHVLAAPARLGATRLVCVDGPAGSGKSTVAQRLAGIAERRGLTVRVLRMDDLYEGWDGAVRGFALLRDHVLARIAGGLEGRYRRYDWHSGAYAERHVVPADLDLLIVEGEALRDRWLDWMRWERDHFATERTRQRADLIVDGAPEVPHDPEQEIVVKPADTETIAS